VSPSATAGEARNILNNLLTFGRHIMARGGRRIGDDSWQSMDGGNDRADGIGLCRAAPS
jgi:hypothetical protein